MHAAAVNVIGASLEAHDLAIRDVAGDEGTRPGRGFDLERGGTATIERVLVARVHDDGVFGEGEGTTSNATDVSIEDVDSAEATGFRGHGISIQARALATVTRLRVLRARNAGVSVHEMARLVLSDAAVHETLGRRLDSALGRGIAVQTGAHAELARIDIEAASGLGLAAFEATTHVTAVDVRVHDTTQAECAATSCPADGAGVGAGADAGAELVSLEPARAESDTRVARRP